ncbi:MAG TPA: transporter substrate-binding domain-containing protein [Steroidobacteraceae bacterium]|nr:transporter substrate-binding domain-containing protein [Steroidobacteraceae bacterium]
MRKIYGTQPAGFLALLVACLASTGCGTDTASVAETEANNEAAAATPAPTVDVPDTGIAPIAPIALAKWTGDLDGMIERRIIRVLTTYSKTSFFIDQGTQRGLVPDAFKLFEDGLNKRLKNKHLRVQVVIVPFARDELMPALLEGRGDIVAAGTLINDWRRESVDFTDPSRSGISIIPVTGPGVPPVTDVQELGGRELYLRPSDVPRGGVGLQCRAQSGRQTAGPRAPGARSARGRLKTKVPVLIAYWTAWVDADGRMNFRRDLYGQDARWAAALDAPFKVRAKPLFEADRSPGRGTRGR